MIYPSFLFLLFSRHSQLFSNSLFLSHTPSLLPVVLFFLLSVIRTASCRARQFQASRALVGPRAHVGPRGE